MGKIAFVFPGQGAQAVGMGQQLAQTAPELAAFFEEADRVLGFSLSQLMFSGPEEQLVLTEHTQPALVTTAMAAHHLVITRTGVRPDYVAGHSLGEYAAICAAGGFSFADAVRLVRLRGAAMQAAVPVGVGGMAAMIGMENDAVEALCQQAAQERNEICVAANFNAPGQVVISGHKGAVERTVALARAQGKKGMLLPVSAPFHCPLMQPAADKMAAALAETTLADTNVPVVANVTAAPVTLGADIRDLLVRQVTGAVRWEASIRHLRELGVDTFIEMGTGKVLSGIIKRIDKEARVLTVNGAEDLAALSSL